MLDLVPAIIRSVDRIVRRGERGQGLAEYALLLGLIAMVAIVALLFLGNTITAMMSNLGNSL